MKLYSKQMANELFIDISFLSQNFNTQRPQKLFINRLAC